MKHSILLFIHLLVFQIAFAQTNSGWTITANSRIDYHALTLANGMIGLLPSAKPFQFEKVVLNGVYDRYGKWGDGISNIVQGVDFLNLDMQVDSGASIKDATDDQLKNWKQELNMKDGSFTTSFIYDGKIEISYTIYTLRQLPYDALMTVTAKALQDEELSVSNSFIGSESAFITNSSFDTIEKISLSSAIAKSPTGKIQLAASNSFLFPEEVHPEIIGSPNKIQLLSLGNTHAPQLQNLSQGKKIQPMNIASASSKFRKKLKKGETFQFALVGAICSSSHFPDPKNEAKRLTILANLEGTEKLIAQHKQAWNELWKSDIIIDGDVQAQQDVRFALFNLYSFVREGTSFSMSPMGLSGTGYNGHVFWDCEIWMYPVLLALHPEIAKSLLDYRYNRLETAKQNAFSNGYKGAMFPWESAEDGTEETPVWALTGPFEHHITADIGIAFWNYYAVTKDKEWLKQKGFPVLKEVADFWVSRTIKNNKGEYEIKNVVCADEYAENVDNNAFTNGAAIVAMRNAIKAANELGVTPDAEWKIVSDNIPLRFTADSVVKEYETYNGQTIKQADANLLSYPLDLLNPKLDKKNLDYYEPKVDKQNGPAMTYSIFSIISSRLGNSSQAYQYFQDAHIPNQRAPFGVFAETATSNNPYFATGAGGMLQAVLYGFAGLNISDNGITQLKTKLPAKWKKITVTGVGSEHKTFSVGQ